MDRLVKGSDVSPQAPQGERSVSDVALLLVELGRALRARQFYPAGHPALADLIDHAWRAWHADLERFGTLQVEIRDGAFWLPGMPVAVGRGRLDELARDLAHTAGAVLRAEPPLTRGGFQAWIERLGSDEPHSAGSGPESVAGAERPRSERHWSEQIECDVDLLLGTEGAEPAARHATDRLVALALRAVESQAPEAVDSALERLLSVSRDRSTDTPMREAAISALRRLLRGAVGRALLERVCSADPRSRIPAAQLVLRLGSSIAPTLLDAVERAKDGPLRSQLGGVLLSLGQEALPTLLGAFEARSPDRLRTAVRLAGESQNPRFVPPLRRLMLRVEPGLRRDVGKALAQIGSPAALEALADLLRHPEAEVAALGAFCLGSSRNRSAGVPLLRGLDRALREGRVDLAREVVRALGRLGATEAVPSLVAILGRRSLRRRRRLRELKIAAVGALARLPGPAARRALADAAKGSDALVRRAAQTALGESAAAGASAARRQP